MESRESHNTSGHNHQGGHYSSNKHNASKVDNEGPRWVIKIGANNFSASHAHFFQRQVQQQCESEWKLNQWTMATAHDHWLVCTVPRLQIQYVVWTMAAPTKKKPTKAKGSGRQSTSPKSEKTKKDGTKKSTKVCSSLHLIHTHHSYTCMKDLCGKMPNVTGLLFLTSHSIVSNNRFLRTMILRFLMVKPAFP